LYLYSFLPPFLFPPRGKGFAPSPLGEGREGGIMGKKRVYFIKYYFTLYGVIIRMPYYKIMGLNIGKN